MNKNAESGILIMEGTRIRWADEKICNITGYDLEELTGEEASAFFDINIVGESIVRWWKKDGSILLLALIASHEIPEKSERILILIPLHKHVNTPTAKIDKRKNILHTLVAENFFNGVAALINADLRVVDAVGVINGLFYPDSLKGRTLREIFPKESIQAIEGSIHKATEGITIVIQISYNGRMLKIETMNCSEEGMSGIMRIQDVTKEDINEGAILKAKREWEMTFDAVPDLIAILDTEFNIVRANKTMANKLHMNQKELIGKKCFACFHGDQCHIPQCPHRKLLDDGKEHSEEIALDIVDGNYLVTVSPLYDNEGRLTGSVHVAHDISERKRMEEKLRNSETRFRSLAENSPDIIYLFDVKDKRIIYCNRSTILGNPPEDADQLGLFSHKINPEDINNVKERRVQALLGEDVTTEYRLQRPEGGWEWVQSRETTLETDENSHTLLLVSMTIITDRKVIEEGLKKAHDEMEMRVYERTTELMQANMALHEEVSERRLAERELILFRNLIDQSNDAIFVVDSNTLTILDANEKACTDAGYEREVLLSLKISDLETQKHLWHKQSILARESGAALFESVHVRSDDSIYPVEVSLKHINQPSADYLVAVVRDITERKIAEQALRDSEEIYRLHFENVSDIVFSIDRNMKIINISPSVKTILGYEQTELKNKKIVDMGMISPGFIDSGLADMEKVFEGETITNREYKFISRDGDVKVCEVNFAPMRQGNEITALIGVARDITLRKRAKDELRKMNKEILTLFITSTSLQLAKTVDDITSIAMQAFISIGYDRVNLFFTQDGIFTRKIGSVDESIPIDKTFSQDVYDLVIKGDFVVLHKADAPELHRFVGTDEVAVLPLLAQDKLMGIIVLDNHKTKRPLNHKDISRLMSFTNQVANAIDNVQLLDEINSFNSRLQHEIDIATKELRDKNAELERMNKLKSDFVSNVSHEFRTPLTSIYGYAKLLSHEKLGKLNKNQKDSILVILEESSRLSRLINDVLDLSKLEADWTRMRSERVNLSGLATNAMNSLRNMAIERGISVSLHCDSSLGVIDADRDMIYQVFINLLSNAIKFSSEKSMVDIIIQNKGDMAEVIVKDRGVGIPAHAIPKIFDKFYQVDSSPTRKHGGTGLGLVIVKRIIEDHKGNIRVDSKVGEGTTFTILIPKHQNTEDESESIHTNKDT